MKPDWIAVDWGTTHLRAWAMCKNGEEIDEAISDQGMGQLDQSQFASVLAELTAHWNCDGPIIACGMVGSRQGWAEAPYATTPCPAMSDTLISPEGHPNVHIIPGIKQNSPADVMRGEETQIAGFMAMQPHYEGIVVLPGTHTKWAYLSANEVVSFQTFMTGEIFAYLTERSVLRHSIGDGWKSEAFLPAVEEALSKPEALAARLFNLRADDLLNGADPDAARARLSGLLIGAEIAAAKPYWLGRQLMVLGSGPLMHHYIGALHAQGVRAMQGNVKVMTTEGLKVAYRQLKAKSR